MVEHKAVEKLDKSFRMTQKKLFSWLSKLKLDLDMLQLSIELVILGFIPVLKSLYFEPSKMKHILFLIKQRINE